MILIVQTKFSHKVLSKQYYHTDSKTNLCLFFNNQYNFFGIYGTSLLLEELEKDQKKINSRKKHSFKLMIEFISTLEIQYLFRLGYLLVKFSFCLFY